MRKRLASSERRLHGHKSPQIHLQMLKTADKYGFTFDTLQMPLNVMDVHFDSSVPRAVQPISGRFKGRSSSSERSGVGKPANTGRL